MVFSSAVIELFKRLLWFLQFPWPRSAIEGRILPLQISVCPPDRFSECVTLLQRNEAHGVPSHEQEHYLSGLQDGGFLALIAEKDGRIVGTFGMYYLPVPFSVWLCYVLVDPDHHRRGIGTTMFLAALALLPENQPEFTLLIQALPTSAGFYYRFGFERLEEVEDASGQIHQIASLRVTYEMISGCRALLKTAGASLPPVYDTPRAEAAHATSPVEVERDDG